MLKYSKVRDDLGFYSAHPMPTRAELASFYASAYFQTPTTATYSTAYSDEEIAHRKVRFGAILDLAAEHGISGGAFLDIGAGEGFLMRAATDRGFDVHGVDFSDYGLQQFHPGLKDSFTAEDITDHLRRSAEGGKRYDLCTATNVLEHVIDPRELLDLMRGVLSADGLAIIVVPNDYSTLQLQLLADATIDREFWFAPPQHLHYFNSSNLGPLCTSRGFDVLDMIGDFPIDLLLMNPSTNYVADPSLGKAAHQMRIQTDMLISKAGPKAFLSYYRALAATGLGRNIGVVVRPSATITP